MEVVKLSQRAVNKAIIAIKNGKVVVFPTDTVYGFLAGASDKKAVENIFKIKKRLKSKPLAVFVRDFKMAEELAYIDKSQKKVLKKYWPGKYTFVLKVKKGNNLCKLVIKDNAIALRIPKYKPLNNLLKKINKPLDQTSVNISGKPPLTKIGDIIKQFEKSDILIIDAGNLPKSKSSAIIDLTKNKIKILRK